MTEHPQDRVEDHIELPTDVFREKPQHHIAVLLQQLVLPPVATVRGTVGEMLGAIQFHRNSRVDAE